MSAPAELQPLTVPACERGIVDKVRCSAERLKRVRVLTKTLRLVRPNGESPAGALLDAIAEGMVVLRRADDPFEREFRVKAGDLEQKAAKGAKGLPEGDRPRARQKVYWWQNREGKD